MLSTVAISMQHLLPTSPYYRFFVAAVAVLLATALSHAPPADAKRKRGSPPVPPALRITSVTLTPIPYVPSHGPLDLAIEIELPKDLAGVTLLEVSTLISSPSKRSMRFLSARQPIQGTGEQSLQASAPASDSAGSGSAPPAMLLRLTWDGTDQTKQQVTSGKYSYEVRAKLLVMGENGPRTHMVSWPRRGILEIE